jgi:hypothetical protein
LYNAACAFALCAATIDKGRIGGAALPNDDALTADHAAYIEKSLACLSEAVAAGWNDAAHTRTNPGLAVLRDLPEFQKIVEEMSQTPAAGASPSEKSQ